MRSRQQLELTPGEYSDAKKRERQRILVELQQLLDRAAAREAPWYMWLLWRRDGVHRHDLTRDDGTPVACPVPGCYAVAGLAEQVGAGAVDDRAAGGDDAAEESAGLGVGDDRERLFGGGVAVPEGEEEPVAEIGDADVEAHGGSVAAQERSRP